VIEFGTPDLVVTYPEELLEDAVEKMARHGVGRLPVVDRAAPGRLMGYLGRTGLLEAWLKRVEEEEVREAGAVHDGLRSLVGRARSTLSFFRPPISHPHGGEGA